MNNTIILLPLMALISACGSSGGSSGAPNTGGGSDVSYGDLNAEYGRIRKDSARVAQNQGYTTNLPTSGTATYAGVASFSESANPQIIANANLNVDFRDSSMSGSLSNFRGDDGTVFDGAMNLSDGAFDGSDGSISADISGHLTSDSARMSTVDSIGEFAGNFIGDNHQYVRGTTSAIWTTNTGTGTEEHIRMQGELAAEKQY